MLKGEKRIRRIEQDLGRQIVGRAWDCIIEGNSRTISRKEFNSMVGRRIRLDSIDSREILSALENSGRIKITQRKIKLL